MQLCTAVSPQLKVKLVITSLLKNILYSKLFLKHNLIKIMLR